MCQNPALHSEKHASGCKMQLLHSAKTNDRYLERVFRACAQSSLLKQRRQLMESETKACMAHAAIARTMTAMFNECAAIEAIFSMFHVKQLLFIVHGAVKNICEMYYTSKHTRTKNKKKDARSRKTLG